MKKKAIYLVAHYVTKPRDPRKTHIPGYMKDPANHQYDEQVHIVLDFVQKILLVPRLS